VEETNFEESMKSLEKIADELEKDDLDLDTQVKKFEEGMKLANKCNELLKQAEKKITILVNGEEKDFVPTNEE
jgi:exodeoxyribonuclease VII small subunit